MKHISNVVKMYTNSYHKHLHLLPIFTEIYLTFTHLNRLQMVCSES